MMKLGAAASFLPPDQRGGQRKAEVLESETVRRGVLEPVEPVMISRKLWDGDKIIMVSDGVPGCYAGSGEGESVPGISGWSARRGGAGDGGDDLDVLHCRLREAAG